MGCADSKPAPAPAAKPAPAEAPAAPKPKPVPVAIPLGPPSGDAPAPFQYVLEEVFEGDGDRLEMVIEGTPGFRLSGVVERGECRYGVSGMDLGEAWDGWNVSYELQLWGLTGTRSLVGVDMHTLSVAELRGAKLVGARYGERQRGLVKEKFMLRLKVKVQNDMFAQQGVRTMAGRK
eukprot:TRINITY_DN3092_c0_g1_i1.p2 TRINITY_DN3092_c0_g1~~TRINITY_DN3092_c0_g1_i1.p2  ORF type:complete len:177 (+),score=50.47 TRINITY_DN3092_c0_g1_i1:58-588(+)